MKKLILTNVVLSILAGLLCLQAHAAIPVDPTVEIMGTFDGCNESYCWGWVIDNKHRANTMSFSLTITNSSAIFCQGQTTEFRADVNQAFPGATGNKGFRCEIPNYMKTGQTIGFNAAGFTSAFTLGNYRLLDGSPKTITLPNTQTLGFYLGKTQDKVGPGNSGPNGIPDNQVDIINVPKKIKRVTIANKGGWWENPYNGLNWNIMILTTNTTTGTTLHLFFEPWGDENFAINLYPEDGSSAIAVIPTKTIPPIQDPEPPKCVPVVCP